MTWFHDAINGNNMFRNLTLIQISTQTGDEVSRTSIGNGFIRDFAVGDLDGSVLSLNTLRFIVVPGSLVTVASNATSTASTGPTFRQSNFRVEIAGVDPTRIAAVRGLHMSAPKILVSPQIGLRHQFLPGAPSFDTISIEMSLAPSTAANFDTWAHNIAIGQEDSRDGVLNLMDTSLTNVLAEVDLFHLSPVAFPPFLTSATRRTIILSVDRFFLQ